VNTQRLERHCFNISSIVRSILCGVVMVLTVGGAATLMSDTPSPEAASNTQTIEVIQNESNPTILDGNSTNEPDT